MEEDAYLLIANELSGDRRPERTIPGQIQKIEPPQIGKHDFHRKQRLLFFKNRLVLRNRTRFKCADPVELFERQLHVAVFIVRISVVPEIMHGKEVGELQVFISPAMLCKMSEHNRYLQQFPQRTVEQKESYQ